MADFKLSQRDWQQTFQYSHDDATNSMRVNMVAADGLIDGIKESLKDIKVEVNAAQSDSRIQVIEVPKVIVETKIEYVEVEKLVEKEVIKEIQVPVIIKEIELKEIEKVVYVPEVQLVDRPIIVEKSVDNKDNKLNYILIIQTILIGLLIYKLF